MTAAAGYLLVLVRLSGMIALNPLLARRNVPAPIRAGLSLLLTLLIAPGLPGLPTAVGPMLLLQELLVGMAIGFVFQLFYAMLFFTGDLLDIAFGLSMARVFDPGTNMQTSLSGNLLGMVFSLLFFVTDSHLVLIRLFAASFEIVAPATAALSAPLAGVVLDLFITAFSLAVRLALPFLAAEFVLEISMGILMKLIPQIHVFVINIQFKVLLGIVLLLLFSGPTAAFLDNYLTFVLEQTQRVIESFA